MDIGFGPGQLRRDHHVTVVEGAPYVLGWVPLTHWSQSTKQRGYLY